MNKGFCPNKRSKEFKELSEIFGEDKAYFLWMRNKGNHLDKAPNGADSKLFNTLLDYFKGDREEALKAKAKVYSNNFFSWFGNWAGEEESLSEIKKQNPYSSEITIGKASPDYDSADRNGAGAMFAIRKNGEYIGSIAVNAYYRKGDNIEPWGEKDTNYVSMSSVGDAVEIEKEFRGKGYGKAAYFEFAKQMANMGYVLRSAPAKSRTEASTRVWKSLVRDGYAKEAGDRYEFINSSLNNVSKVVDENGEPLIVWHGQASTNYVKEFDAKSTFFTENKAVAEKYGDKFRHPLDESDKAIPVFLNIKTPHIYDAEGREYKNVNGGNFLDFDDFLSTHQEYQKEGWYWDYQVGEENIIIPENVLNEYHKLSTSKTVRTYVSEKIGKDNDGVIVRNVLDPASGKVTDTTPLITDYVANTPNQIKHIDNRDGEYTGPNIYHNVTLKSIFDKLKSLAEYEVIELGRMSLAQFNSKYGTNLRYADKFKTRLRVTDVDSIWGIPVSTKNDKKINIQRQISTVALRSYLVDKFGLKLKVISDSEYDKKITPNKASSCCVKGDTVYIRQSRNENLTNEQYIEEFLHPTIHELYKNNRELSNNLVKQARLLFPDLCKQIEYIYKLQGNDVIEEEIITQVLSKYLNKEISDNGENYRDVLDYIKQFFEHVFQLFNDLFGNLRTEELGRQKNLVISGKDIVNVFNYETLSQIINSKQIIFRDVLNDEEVRLNTMYSDNSSISSILQSTQSDNVLNKTADDSILRSTAIEHSINNTRDAFVQQQVEKYMSTNKDATAADIYGVRIGSSVDWDEAAVKRVISEQQEKMAKAFGLKKRELPNGGFVYTSEDKSKDSRLRVCFVNSITGQDWTDEDGVLHKGMFEEGSKSEEAAWNAIYISLETGDATTFTHEMAHYYIRTFWESQAVQDALLEVDKTLGKKDHEEAKQYSRRLEEKLVEWLTDRSMKNQEPRSKFYSAINSILHMFGKDIKKDENIKNNILDSLQAAFLINQDLADKAAEIIYFEKYIGPVEQTTRLSDEVEELAGTTFWKIKSTLESREKSERSRGKADNYDLLNIRAHLQKIQKRSITNKDDIAATVSDFLLLAAQDTERAIVTLSNIILGGEDAILNLDVDDFMHLKTDVVGYYDTMLTNTIDDYLRGSKTISEDLRNQLLQQKDNIRPNLDILKNAFDRVLKQFVDKKIEQYAEELVTVGDKDIFITNMKLWARNQIGEGKLMFLENALGPAAVSRSPIVRLVEYLVTAQNRISYESSLKVGHELIDRYKKCASIGKKVMSINFMKQFCELDDDGNPTGYFARKYNYGKLYRMRDKLIERLIDKYKLTYDESTNKIHFKDRDTYIRYMTDFYNEMDKFANFRYKKEYYIARATMLSQKALDKQKRIQRQIDTLLEKAMDKDLGVPMLFNLSSEEMDQLENLKKERENLANPYVFVYNSDGSISHMEEKSGEDLEIAKEFIAWNAYKANKIKYKSNFDKFNEIRKDIVDKYGENSNQVKIFDNKYKTRRISPKFYEEVGEYALTPKLQELYARKRAIIYSIMNKRGYYQPNLKKLNDQAFAELKRIDEEISKAYSDISTEDREENKFNKLATKPWVGEYDTNGVLTANPAYNYFTEKERAARAAAGVSTNTESAYTYTTAGGHTNVLSVFRYTKPKDEDFIEDALLGEYSELDLTSDLVNRDFDDTLDEEFQPKDLEAFKNKNWENIQKNPQLKQFYDGLLQVMEDAYKMLPNFDAQKMKYVLPQMRDRDAKLIFRNRHLLTNIGASVADAFTIVETDTKYNESFSQRADGSVVETIPIRWVSKMKDPSVICTDLVKSVTLFYEMAQNYKNKADINPTLQAMLFMVQGGYSSQTIVDGNSQQAERIQKYLQMYVYGRTRTGFDSKKPMDKRAKAISQLTDTILSKAHGKLMSHNWRAVLKNFVDSFLTDMGEIMSGKYITVKDALWANKEMAMEIFSTTRSFGRANNKSKIAALMQLNGASGSISEIFGQHNETWLRRVVSKHFAMGEFTLVDYTFKGHLTTALYHSIRLVKNPITKELEFMTKDQAMFHYHDAGLQMEDGVKAWKNSKITLFDAYEVDSKGNAVVKNKYRKYVFPIVKSTGKESRRLVNQVTGIIRERSAVINGILDQSGSSAWKQNVVGALVLQMRGWMISQMWDNLKDGHDFAEYESQWRQIIDSSNDEITVSGPGASKRDPNVNGIEKKIVSEDPEYRGQYNFETGTVEHGQWRGLFNSYKHALGDLINRIATFYKHSRRLENSKKLTRNERYKIRRLNTMAATFLIICGLTYITTGLRLKYPDEWYLHLLNAVNISVISERASQIPVFAPLSILDIVNSIIISKTLIDDADKFVDLIRDVVQASDDATIDKIDNSEYADPVVSGAYKGIPKWQRDALKVESYLFPDYSVDNVFRSITTTGNDASINYYIQKVSPTKQSVETAKTVMPWITKPMGIEFEDEEDGYGTSSSSSGGWSKGGRRSSGGGSWHR